MAWMKLLTWLVLNMPALIKNIKEIIEIFGGDAKAAKECLAGLDPECKLELKKTKNLSILKKVFRNARRKDNS